MTFKKGQKVYHVKAKEILTVERDEGGVKVIVKDKNGIELSVLRENSKAVEEFCKRTEAENESGSRKRG